MTDEQIKQNAEAYADEHAVRTDGGGWEEEYDYEEQEAAYTAGAHSRDEEIKELEKLLAEMTRLKNSFAGGVDILDRDNKELQEELESLRKGFYERGDKLKELMLKNNQLRNPWIRTEDRLPDKAINKSERSEYVLCRHKNGNYYVAYWHVGLEYWYSMPYKIDKRNITHWMLIPELKK